MWLVSQTTVLCQHDLGLVLVSVFTQFRTWHYLTDMTSHDQSVFRVTACLLVSSYTLLGIIWALAMIRLCSCRGVKITRLALNFKVDYRASGLHNARLQHGTVLTSFPEQDTQTANRKSWKFCHMFLCPRIDCIFSLRLPCDCRAPAGPWRPDLIIYLNRPARWIRSREAFHPRCHVTAGQYQAASPCPLDWIAAGWNDPIFIEANMLMLYTISQNMMYISMSISLSLYIYIYTYYIHICILYTHMHIYICMYVII